MQVSILKEKQADERRVAATPDTVGKFIELGYDVKIEAGAGEKASIPDSLYRDAGATVSKTAEETIKKADLILFVQRPDHELLKQAPKNSVAVGMAGPYGDKADLTGLAETGVTTCTMELLPRITRAQGMDVLSSQANLAGYRAVLDACEYFDRAMPMMMTAAGTIPPARVFVMGAGVAGLQAIATARRLGAIVSATDVRPAAKEQVASLGANFIAVEDEEFKQAEAAGGYAREMSEEYKKKQAELIAETIPKQDIVITTALIPGRPAPELVTEDHVKSMKPGSVIIDLAAPQGGNCKATRPGKVTQKNNVTIIGHLNVPSRLAADSSKLYAKNLLNFIAAFTDKETCTFSLNKDDAIIQGVLLTENGQVVHEKFAQKKSEAA